MIMPQTIPVRKQRKKMYRKKAHSFKFTFCKAKRNTNKRVITCAKISMSISHIKFEVVAEKNVMLAFQES